MKAFKMLDDKHFHRWRAIACCYLDGLLNPNKEIAKLSNGMGLALLKQSLEAIPQGKKNSVAARLSNKQSKTPTIKDPTSPALQNAIDVQLLLLIYKQVNMDEQALSILDGEKAGLKSEVGYGHWNLALVKLDLLKKLNRTGESWKFCYQLLREAAKMELDQDEEPLYNYGRSGDDLAIWRAIAENVYELKDVSLLLKFQELLENPQLKKRHRFLATIDLAVKIGTDKSVFKKTFKTSPTYAIQTYLNHYLDTEVAYEDLRDIAKQLDEEGRLDLLIQVQKMQPKRAGIQESNEQEFRSRMHTRLNELKLRHTLEVSLPQHLHRIDNLEDFAELCVSLYISSLEIEKKYAITERRTGDEAAILAASAFIHLWKAGKKSGRIQATLILEKLLEYSKHHYGALMMLVRLYVLQGCFDLAYKYYSKLNLKNVQTLTETWVLLNRVASIFPYKQQEANTDIHRVLQMCAEYAESKDNSMHRQIESHQSLQNWAMLCEVHEMINLSRVSISRASVIGELSRFYYRHEIGDCFGHDTVLDHMISIQKPNNEGVHSDIRTDGGFPNYEALDSESLSEHLRNGPWTGDIWIKAEDLMFRWRRWTKQRLWCMATPQIHMFESAEQLDFATSLHKSWYQPPPVKDGLTNSERIVAWMLAHMTSFEESTHALSMGHEDLAGDPTKSVDDWELSTLADYEKLWKSCTMVLPNVIRAMDRDSENFKFDPLTVMRASEWEAFHCYYKPTELFMVVPGFLLDRIMNAKAFHKIAFGSDFPIAEFEVFNIPALEGLLRNYLKSAFNIIKKYQLGAKKASTHWNDSRNLEDMVSRARGTKTTSNTKLKRNLEKLFQKDWAKEKSLDITRGWLDSLAGIMYETPQYWHQNRMPKIVEKYMPKL